MKNKGQPAHLVVARSGEYEETNEWVVCVFVEKQDANTMVASLNASVATAREKINRAYMRHLTAAPMNSDGYFRAFRRALRPLRNLDRNIDPLDDCSSLTYCIRETRLFT